MAVPPLRGAADLAAPGNREIVTSGDVFDVLERIRFGAERSVVMPVEQRRRTAYHEAGTPCWACHSRAPASRRR
ncbi:hypothetical protein [Pseudonocardia acidicola]|uniref:Uncharacterized protein n=1 Tax=Pseudonocardia acidicola TaxID=2724939 RepID=A0ABX1S493_9PSEU|nr:hypothetical protein [Pseudonocardia acidicola]NMH95910.1 hypothetical protein [Pseudonocardia acidicola]